MGKIFYLMGKSASGKDTIYKKLMEDPSLGLKGVVMYSTRPQRSGEVAGKDYFFVTPEKVEEFRCAGKVIESRTYDTVYGPWTYATIDDGQIDLEKDSYLMVGVLSAFVEMKEYFGSDSIVPLYIEVEDGLRLSRALERERKGNFRYAELCRRFLADAEDFSEEKLAQAGITERIENLDLDETVEFIKDKYLRK